MAKKQKECTGYCENCRRKFCYYACYNNSCSSRLEFCSEFTGNSCENAHNCMGYISRETYLERQK